MSEASRLPRVLNSVEKPFLATGLLLMILIITYQTCFRYAVSNINERLYDPQWVTFLSSFADVDGLRERLGAIAGWSIWSEELARYVFIWISYLAVPLAILGRSNIRVDFLCEKLPERQRRIVWVLTDLCMLILAGLFCYMGFGHVRMQIAMPQVTPAMGIKYFIPYLILPVGFGLMAIRAIQDLWTQVRSMPAKDTAFGVVLTAALFLPVLVHDEWSAVWLLFGYFVIFLLLGVPIAFALGLSSVGTILGAGTLPLDYLAQIAFVSIDTFPIMAIPFFIAAGVFMGAGGLSKRLLALGDELVGALPGGMALASIVTCIFFASISGSGPATVAAIGTITIPAMIERGYDRFFAAAVVAAAGCIGVMIPPSNPFVVYGVAGQVSVGKLFLAGIVPGLLCGLALMVAAFAISKRNGWQGEARGRSLRTFAQAFWNAKWALLVPVIVLGGIYGGIMTPTEAAAVAALYGLVVGLFIYGELSFEKMWASCVEAAQTSSVIIVLMAMATIFGNIMTIEQVPDTIASFILDLTSTKIVILLFINIFLLWIGTFMEALAAIVIITPILLPLVTRVGVDPLHFGIIMVVNLAIGFITPPVGVNLFVASRLSKARIGDIVSAGWVFLGVLIAMLLVFTYIPWFSLCLVQ